ncbi:protein root UVB sensitive 6 [Juglans microcarpa x Juglans regia]|uniref:protein root UVB sensitive 6 n=1 Tax=Juglans microcarpa x Juglans regia TaxID=2249226 RepID=UPI001B7D918C|nr:protein root UVB sensitive 6 [Juglans microcarpa x Juglans regia]
MAAPPPIKLKQSSPKSAAHTLTSTTSSSSAHDARLLVRETLRISANLASSPPDSAPHPPSSYSSLLHSSDNLGLLQDDFVNSSLRFICCEEIDGRRWNYLAEKDASGSFKKGSIRARLSYTPQVPPIEELMSFVRSYVLPEGFPDSVTPSYVPYMTWRALKHFFGGAMGVFTTQTLLSSVGVSRRATPGAVAINWILKDGAGRVGKMLFARQGKKFDFDLKQLRFAGDLLMEVGAAVELATSAVPHLFLPLACAANVAKNVAAVTSTSTRTPIYKAFAKGENIGDVTAKGECVGNIADLLGTGLSIMISKRNPSLVTTFALLSCGYVLSSYQEVKSVVLHTLNRARFTVAVDSFLKTGRVPSLQEGNMNENIFSFLWLKDGPIVLGPSFRDAFQDPGAYLAIEPLFEKERYIVTYNSSKGKIYALLKDQAKSDDILKAAFHAHMLLHFIQESNKSHLSARKQSEYGYSDIVSPTTDLEAHVVESCKMVSASYGIFKSKAAEEGWKMSESLLNPGRARVHASDKLA